MSIAKHLIEHEVLGISSSTDSGSGIAGIVETFADLPDATENCDLMNKLGIVFIEERMKYMPYSRFEYYIDGRLSHLVQQSNGEIIKLKYDGKL